MSIVVSHPTGTANSRALLRGLAEADLLEAFFTSIALPERFVERVPMPRQVRAELRRRVFAGVPYHRIRTRMVPEILRVGGERLGWSGLSAHETGLMSLDRLSAALARRTAAYLRRPGSHSRLIYAYEDAALEAFRTVCDERVVKVLELPSVEWRTKLEIMREERELNPAWAPTLDPLQDSPGKLARKDEEIAVSDHVVVASRFALNALDPHRRPAESVHLVPYGAPPVTSMPPTERRAGEPLKAVYVGQIGQHKGISYMLDGVAVAGVATELTLIGPRLSAACPAVDLAFREHRWIPSLPHAHALEHMRRHHVMVFPSLCEGFGLVILEAMAQGVPVITTSHTGGPDVIEDGVDGFVVPIRDPVAIAERLTLLYEDEPRRRAMAEAAKRKAAALGWSGYQKSIVGLLRRLAEAT